MESKLLHSMSLKLKLLDMVIQYRKYNILLAICSNFLFISNSNVITYKQSVAKIQDQGISSKIIQVAESCVLKNMLDIQKQHDLETGITLPLGMAHIVTCNNSHV